MDWNRSNSIGLARAGCAQCHGYGLRPGRKGKEIPCNCVFRAAFRACYARFRECVARQDRISTVTLDFCRGRDGRRTYSRKNEEFIADFSNISRRTLQGPDYDVFRFHFLLGADWRMCCRRLKIDRGAFFHTVYRVEQALGRVFCELRPYGLYPVDEYFAGRIEKDRTEDSKVKTMVPMRTIRRWQPALLKTA